MHQYYFERLEVWQQSRQLAMEVYAITGGFPDQERFGITNQIRRATLSIAANIAEGMSRNTDKDKARFINQAYGSAIEVVNFLIISNDLGFLMNEAYSNLRSQLALITNQLRALTVTLKQSQ